jgi:endonuclease-3
VKPTTEDALLVHQLLLEKYGERHWEPVDPVDALVSTILSQNTNDVNRDRAFARLRATYPQWTCVRDASIEDLVEAIRPAGLAPTKAPRIQEALRRCSGGAGDISLEFLRDMPLQDARSWLTGLPGVGPKTAAIVLLFALGRPAFPVDTHVHRTTRRIGLIPEKTNREKAHQLLEAMLPPETYYTFHINLIEHGRETCHARRPNCSACVLRDECTYYAARARSAQS